MTHAPPTPTLKALLADENIAVSSINTLREAGFDVASIAELVPGLNDETVLRDAVVGQRILLTFDRDYGDLVFHRDHTPPPSIIYIRIDPADHTVVTRRLLDALADADIAGKFVTLEEERMRLRPMPHTEKPNASG
jgi:predicted nuclease of predicted toxin-antitoxin system